MRRYTPPVSKPTPVPPAKKFLVSAGLVVGFVVFLLALSYPMLLAAAGAGALVGALS